MQLRCFTCSMRLQQRILDVDRVRTTLDGGSKRKEKSNCAILHQIFKQILHHKINVLHVLEKF